MSSSPVRPDLSDDDDFETEIVGESFKQNELHELASRVDVDNQGRKTFVAFLRADEENHYDKNARLYWHRQRSSRLLIARHSTGLPWFSSQCGTEVRPFCSAEVNESPT